MFKPSLKRSVLDSKGMLFNTPPPNPQQITSFYNPTLHQSSTLIVPQNLLKPLKFGIHREHSLASTPLCCMTNKYPKPVSALIRQHPLGIKAGKFGYYKNIHWFHIERQIILWYENDGTNCQIYNFSDVISACTTGCIKTTLQMNTRQKDIMILTFGNRLIVYDIDTLHLELKENIHMKFIISKVSNIHQVLLIGNIAVVAGNTCYAKAINLGGPTHIHPVHLPLTNKMLPPSALGRVSCHVEKIIHNGNYLYCLIRRRKTTNWLYRNMHNACIYFISQCEGTRIPQYTESKFIDVYYLQKDCIKYLHSLDEQTLKQRLIISYTNVADTLKNDIHPHNHRNIRKNFGIANIYIDNSQDDATGTYHKHLGVVLYSGYFATLTSTNPVQFWREPRRIPRYISDVGIAAPYRKEQIGIMQNIIDNQVISSLGYNNLTLTKEGLVYYNDQALDVIKCYGVEGMLLQKENKQDRQWQFFTEQVYYSISCLNYKKIVLLYVHTKFEEEIKKGNSLFDSKGQFQDLLEELAIRIGYAPFCRLLMEILLKKQYKFKVNQWILSQLVQRQLQGQPKLHFHNCDWRVQNNLPWHEITLETPMLDTVWTLLLEYQSKPLKEPAHGQSKKKQANALWYALSQVYYGILQPLFLLYPREAKSKITDLHQILSQLRGLGDLLREKSARERKNYNYSTKMHQQTTLFKNRFNNIKSYKSTFNPALQNKSAQFKTISSSDSKESGHYLQAKDSYRIYRNREHQRNLNNADNWKNNNELELTLLRAKGLQNENETYNERNTSKIEGKKESPYSKDQQLQSTKATIENNEDTQIESTLQLEELIIQSVPKLQILVCAFYYLMEDSQRCKNFPSFRQTLLDFDAQCTLKAQLLHSRHINPKLLTDLCEKIPELQFQKDLRLFEWVKVFLSDPLISIESIDLPALAQLLNEEVLKKIAPKLEGFPDCHLRLLLSCLKRLGRDLHFMQKKEQLDILPRSKSWKIKGKVPSNGERLFEVKKMQRMSQFVDVLCAEVKRLISRTSSNAANVKTQNEYEIWHRRLENMIQQMVLHDDPILLQYFEYQLRRVQLIEKVLILKNMITKAHSKCSSFIQLPQIPKLEQNVPKTEAEMSTLQYLCGQ